MYTNIRVCMDALKKGRAAHQVGTLWEKDHIRVFYMDGSFDLTTRVARIARQWSDVSGIPFVPAKSKGESDVRVTFAPGGSWSFIGNQALSVSYKDPTMQLGWVNDNTSHDEMQQVVLHEFGHVMGLLHEHQNPSHGIQWDKERVYSYYTGYPNYWSRNQVDINVFDKYDKSLTQFTDFDPSSIMLYPIPEAFTLDEYEVSWNCCLSDVDKDFVRRLYSEVT